MIESPVAMDSVFVGSLLGLLLLITVVGLLIYLATKFGGRVFALLLLGCGAVLFLMMFVGIRVSHQHQTEVVEHHGGAVETSTAGMLVTQGRDASSGGPISHTSDLWENLTRSKIAMDVGGALSEGTENTEEAEEVAEASAERPDWVDHPPKRVGNVSRQVVSSDPFVTVDECHRQLEWKLRDAVQERLRTVVAQGSWSYSIDLNYILREICRDEFTETVSASVGEMKRVHVLMEFSPAVDSQLRAIGQDYERTVRLETAFELASVVLGLLLLVYGLLKFDTWTHGYYTKRLLLGVPVVIIAIVVLLSFV